MSERIYLVRYLGTPSPQPLRLVRAPNRAQALRHVADDILTADVASQNDLVELVGRGMKVEDVAVARALRDAATDAAWAVPNAETRQAMAELESGNGSGPFVTAAEALAEATSD